MNGIGIHLGRRYVITGAGSGIGREVATLLGSQGARLALADCNFTQVSAVADEIRSVGGNAVPLAVDITNESDVERMLTEAESAFGSLDGAFNNAGIAAAGSYSFGTAITDIDIADFRSMVDVNLIGMFLCLKHELKSMNRPGVSIVNNASAAGLIGITNGAPYVAAKHGAVGLTKAAALEGARNGIRVNSVCPGFVESPMLLDHATEEGKESRRAITPIGRLGQPSEVAELVAWLLSPVSSFMTGANIPIDGGLSVGAQR
ncbi:hypothetical protein BDB13_6139 [Rhodococcus sp. OK302]|nr:hypothetical protein BDB13_6139 [Rhodococcus sp. OK302]